MDDDLELALALSASSAATPPRHGGEHIPPTGLFRQSSESRISAELHRDEEQEALQAFAKLTASLRDMGEKFVDPDFPPTSASVGRATDARGMVCNRVAGWRRPVNGIGGGPGDGVQFATTSSRLFSVGGFGVSVPTSGWTRWEVFRGTPSPSDIEQGAWW